MGAKSRPFSKTLISISVRTLLLRLNAVSEQKYPVIRVALISTDLLNGKLWSDICNSSKIDNNSFTTEGLLEVDIKSWPE